MINKPIPTLTLSFLDFFKKTNFKDKICVEIGSGDSTIYWSEYFKKIISYENNLNYLNELKKRTKNILNIDVLEFKKNIFSNIYFKKNIHDADVIIIDNDPDFISRKDFCIFAKENKKEKSLIILDNGNWNIDAYDYLIKNFFCFDFPGLNKTNELTVTSLFFEERKKYI